MEHAGLDEERVVVAGDTLNDLSLFETELKGIVVGDAEPELCRRVELIGGRAYLATLPGGGGIIEGLRHHGLVAHPSAEAEEAGGRAIGAGAAAAPASASPVEPGHSRAADLVQSMGGRAGPAAGDGLPSAAVRDGDARRPHGRRRPKSPNGIIPTLLGFFGGGEEGVWVAWSKSETREPDDWEERVPVDPKRYPNLTAVPIPLTPEDVNLFYETFSKEALWPVIFSFPDKAVFDRDHWEHYLEINRIFAERTAAVADHGALVWVHDYNLWMVPHYLRALRPDLTIAFFHHTSFPASDIFNIIPWRARSSTACSTATTSASISRTTWRTSSTWSARTRRSKWSSACRRRRASARSAAPWAWTRWCARSRSVIGACAWARTRSASTCRRSSGSSSGRRSRRRSSEIRDELKGRTGILSIERLDYVKGPLEKLQAFERLLEDHPELHGRVVLLSVNTPPAPGMRAYRSTRERVDEAVGRINGRFAQLDWTPVRYFYRSLPYEEVIAHYAVSDVAWITPLRDGLNMVAKEYIAANHAVGGRHAGPVRVRRRRGRAARLAPHQPVQPGRHGARPPRRPDDAGP
jgi:glucosylglycerol-phosphate synthase